jgi:nucleobase:cation symporter-1, NCS1 family
MISLSFKTLIIISLAEQNLSANSIGAGCDMTSLFPKMINIRRGSYVAAILGLAYCPWRLFASSNAFTTYLSAYSVLLSSVVGVMLCDYYFVRKGHYRVSDIYTNIPSGWYRYTYGVNLRAFAAYLAGIAPNIPGLVNAVTGKDVVSVVAIHIYTFSWFTGIAVSMSVYYILNMIWPSAGAFPGKFSEVDESEYEVNGVVKPVAYDEPHSPSTEYDEKKYDVGGSRASVVELTA